MTYFGLIHPNFDKFRDIPRWTVNSIFMTGFRDAENVDGIAESSHKNGIYSSTRNVTEFVKV